jgi:hypothetical protein
MSEFWSGLFFGFLFGVVGNLVVNHYWEHRGRRQVYLDAKRIVGSWKAYNIRGQELEPMEGAGDTVITAKPHSWSVNSNVLDVHGVDNSDGRHHSGVLVIDPACPRNATRILVYGSPTPVEVMEQRIVIGHDFRTLFVFPVLATLGLRTYTPAHVLQKVEGPQAKTAGS